MCGSGVIINSGPSQFRFSGGSGDKKSACSAGDLSSIPRSGRSHSSILAGGIPWTEKPGGLTVLVGYT